jgi:hypothetical protein
MELLIHSATLLVQPDFIPVGNDEQLLGADVHTHYPHADSEWSVSMSF